MSLGSFLKFLFGVDDDIQKTNTSDTGGASEAGGGVSVASGGGVGSEAQWTQLDEAQIKTDLERQIKSIEEAHRQEIEAFEVRIKEFEESKLHEMEAQEEQLVHAAGEKIQRIKEAKQKAEEERRRKIEEARRKAEEARRQAEEERKRQEEEARKKAEELRLRQLEEEKKAEQLRAQRRNVQDVQVLAAPTEQEEKPPSDLSFLDKLRNVGIAVDDKTIQKNTDNKLHSFLKRLKGREAEEAEKSKSGEERVELPGMGNILDVDIYQNPSEFIIYAQMPGVDMSTLEIIADKELDTVIIKGGKKAPEGFLNEQEKGGKYIVKDCKWGPVYRKIVLPEEVDVYDSWAKLDRGVLILKLPLLRAQKDRAAQRRIKIIGEE